MRQAHSYVKENCIMFFTKHPAAHWMSPPVVSSLYNKVLFQSRAKRKEANNTEYRRDINLILHQLKRHIGINRFSCRRHIHIFENEKMGENGRTSTLWG